jgi:hypothetical protein
MPYQDKPGVNKEERPNGSWWSSLWSRPDKKAEAQRLAKEAELRVRQENEDREDKRAEARRRAEEAELRVREDK